MNFEVYDYEWFDPDDGDAPDKVVAVDLDRNPDNQLVIMSDRIKSVPVGGAIVIRRAA
jgi:hypothetical protein